MLVRDIKLDPAVIGEWRAKLGKQPEVADAEANAEAARSRAKTSRRERLRRVGGQQPAPTPRKRLRRVVSKPEDDAPWYQHQEYALRVANRDAQREAARQKRQAKKAAATEAAAAATQAAGGAFTNSIVHTLGDLVSCQNRGLFERGVRNIRSLRVS